MSAWSEYSVSTGLLTGRQFSPTREFAMLNVYRGCDVIQGEYDWLKYRVVDGRPQEYEHPSAAKVADDGSNLNVVARLNDLEAKSARAMREIVLAIAASGVADIPQAALDKLTSADAEAVKLRKDML